MRTKISQIIIATVQFCGSNLENLTWDNTRFSLPHLNGSSKTREKSSTQQKGKNCTNTKEERRLQTNNMQTARQAVIIYEREITTNIWASKELPQSKSISRSRGISGTIRKDGQEWHNTLLQGLCVHFIVCTLTSTAH